MLDNEKSQNSKRSIPKKQNRQPGIESEMEQFPQYEEYEYQGSSKLADKTVVITGGDSGIGRAVAALFASEGANIVITYLDEHDDANTTKKIVESKNRQCLTFAGDVTNPSFCQNVIKSTIKKFNSLDILINNSAQQYPQDSIEDISNEQLELIFKTNVFSFFYTIKAALPYLKKGATIINTTSVTAYKGSEHLIDYSATKGAIVTLTRSLSENLIKKGIRVNGVAPGPVWTPLIPASFSAKELKEFGKETPMNRAAETKEIAFCYLFLASEEMSSYMSGQILHPNGGVIVNG